MAMLIRFNPSGLTTEQYYSVGEKLEEGGHWPPQGMLSHVCFGSSGNLRISEVWESREQLEQFAQKLMPLLQEANLDPGEPEILDVEAYFMREASSEPPAT